MTLEERIKKLLAPFVGKKNCQENREKMAKILAENLDLTPEMVNEACDRFPWGS